ncbi:MAG: alpha/beta hydrolase [Verrucomicrobiota bacterium]|nr:alpha/beta hydrolase [Verrucomicrobiota bacterium]
MKKSLLARLLRAACLAYVGLVLLVACVQRSFIYHPFREPESAQVTRATQTGMTPWRDAQGRLIGWKRAARNAAPPANRLLVFHGNTGYALHRTHFVRGFESLDDRRTWEVYLFEYPGYGARPGKIGEEPFIEAGLAALDTLAAADSRPIYLLGESLGSGLGSALAGRRPEVVRGLFLLTPYARMVDVAAAHMPWFPARWLLRDRWDNVAALKTFHRPLAVLVAGQDEVLTAAQGHLIFEEYAGPKRLWVDETASHNTIEHSIDTPWRREISAFLLDAP